MCALRCPVIKGECLNRLLFLRADNQPQRAGQTGPGDLLLDVFVRRAAPPAIARPPLMSSDSKLSFVVIARIPKDGVGFFQIYEDRVLPLLKEHGGELQRRMRNEDGTIEMHVVVFHSQAALDAYRDDFRRTSQDTMLEKSGAEIELIKMDDVSLQ